MSEGLSRREMVGIVGGGLMLAANAPNDIDPDYFIRNIKMAGMGGGFYWGENPHDDPPSSGGVTVYGDFRPSFVTLLYLGIRSDLTMRVNHASYNTGIIRPEKRLEKATQAFEAIISGRNSFKDHQTNHPSHRRVKPGPYYGQVDSDTFDNFRFASKTEIFIFIHQVDLLIGDQTKIFLQDRDVLSFGLRTQAGTLAQPNYSFFNAKPVVTSSRLLEQVGRMIRVENWQTNEGGSAIGADQSYSLNIHYSLPGDGGRRFPMVFDPDTGNGAGNEP